MFSKKILSLSKQLIEQLSQQNKTLISVESCTGGLLAGALTEIPGSSKVVYAGLITYANQAKEKIANVPTNLLKQYGAVSKEVALAMAKGALEKYNSDITISITGIAGPSGATKEKPVGLVHFACATNNKIIHKKQLFNKNMNRQEIRLASVELALNLIIQTVNAH